MHSILDILGGLAISFLYITIGWKYLNDVQLYIATNTFSPVVAILANFCSGWFYPGGNCASRKDTVMILGVGAGVNVATWSNYQLGIFLFPERILNKFQPLMCLLRLGLRFIYDARIAFFVFPNYSWTYNRFLCP